MADDKKNKSPKAGAAKEDRWLWQEVTKSVTPLPEEPPSLSPAEKPHPYPPKSSASSPYALKNNRADSMPLSDTAKDPRPHKKQTPLSSSSHQPGLDRRTEDRFRRGKMPLEGTLDLHGMTQAEARPALARFIQHSYQTGKRCVLVITGKGKTRTAGRHKGPASTDDHWLTPQPPGVLKRNVPLWLKEAPLAPLILRTAPAKPNHGGTGALYILLRRKRS